METIFSGHYEAAGTSIALGRAMLCVLSELCAEEGAEPAYFCIGTDRATGDCLGPLVGTRLKTLLPGAHIVGTLENPLHAINLQQALDEFHAHKHLTKLVAIDACLGSQKKVGTISLKRGALTPGTALSKILPSLGDFHVTGMVNVGGFCEHLVLQNTRLYVVSKMADIIATAIFIAHQSGYVRPLVRVPQDSFASQPVALGQ